MIFVILDGRLGQLQKYYPASLMQSDMLDICLGRRREVHPTLPYPVILLTNSIPFLL